MGDVGKKLGLKTVILFEFFTILFDLLLLLFELIPLGERAAVFGGAISF